MGTKSLFRACLLCCALSAWACPGTLHAEGGTPINPVRTPPTQPAQPVKPAQPARIQPVAPATQTPGLAVDEGTILRAQLRQCEEERVQLDIDNDQLRQQLQSTQAKVTSLTQQNVDLKAKLDATTQPGGSLVKAYCADGHTSRNTAGETNDCGYYACEPVSGLCRTVCDMTGGHCREQDSSGYYVCDTQERQCIKAQ
jgi:regulator of replication initiation timing